ncbi:hypothetical protein DCAR_0729447 [Daucus carota subsp. sativus]|uniref:GDSL esterase/lipase EXL3 n=2 Tax=Daucus carota subsp. sativus TaxID=79200 RepID=A0AAF0XKU8_DAUCS|nr:PREDICTED: GDSL esterase/lipase EXL3-like [Daucus carota subsp. sativus]WOH09986.1 hypothetical protein DCAR_0729447 [Daucus carota subsp. sativus]
MATPAYSFRRCSTMLFLPYVLLFLSTTLTTTAIVQLPSNMSIPAVIVFGDSIGDQGNNNNLTTLIKCNFSPYGKDFKGKFATGRFTNSKTPPDLLAAELGIKELIPAYLDPNLHSKDLPTGVSFASGGTGYDPQTSILASVLGLSDQLKLFKDYIKRLEDSMEKKQAHYIISNSLYLVIAGTDDLANTYFSTGVGRVEYDIGAYTNLMVDSAFNFIKELVKLGARRIGVFSAPPVGCLPAQRTLAGGSLRVCAKDRNEASQLYNSKLSAKIDLFAKKHPHLRVAYVDIYHPLLDIIQHPRNYGIEVVDRGCCGTGDIEVAVLCNPTSPTCLNSSNHLFWDSYHPTEAGYMFLTRRILDENIYKIY